ncbi:MAG: transporter substrate-binding domain-containing protein [Pseudomonadota bacterium]
MARDSLATKTAFLVLLFAASLAGPVSVWAQEQAATTASTTEETPPLPRFRHIDLAGKPASFTREQVIVMVDDDFAPFSYSGAAGEAKGIAVETAEAVCAELRTKCSIVLMPWEKLAGGPANSGGVVAGLRLDDKTLSQFQPTRPIYRAIGRFVARKDNELKTITPDELDGKRIAVVAGSGYEAWLKRNFADAEIVPFPTLGEAEDALRGAKVELLFGDGLQLVYWMRGEASQNCCKYIEGAYYDDALFSRPYVFLVRRGDDELRQAFDYALDQLQESGSYARIFGRYIPGRFW